MSRVSPLTDLAQKIIATSIAINMARDITYSGGGSGGSLGPPPPAGLPGLVLRDPESRLTDEEGRKVDEPWLWGLTAEGGRMADPGRGGLMAEGGRSADSGRGDAADPGRMAADPGRP